MTRLITHSRKPMSVISATSPSQPMSLAAISGHSSVRAMIGMPLNPFLFLHSQEPCYTRSMDADFRNNGLVEYYGRNSLGSSS